MPNVLEFNPNRDLTFNANRQRDFDPSHPLLFDPQRPLDFDMNRGRPFGKHGVVFRGLVCPICGASVTEDQPTCTDCGAVFDRPGERKGMPPETRQPAAPAVEPPAYGPPVVPPASELPPPPVIPPARSQPPRARRRPPPPVRAYPPTPKTMDTRNCPFCGARVATENAFCWNCGNRLYIPGR